MKKMKSIVALLLAMVMLLAFAACAKPADDNTDPSASPSDTSPNLNVGEDNAQGNENATITEKPEGIQEGTTFTYWTNYDVPLYCPWIDNRASALLWQVYDNLMMRYKGDSQDLRPCLAAEEPTISEDGLTYVFKIREDAYFTDGEQVNAEAFVNTWDKATKEYQARYFAQVESYEATGEFELTVKLTAPSATIIHTLFTEPQCGPVSPKALNEYGKEDNRSAVGVGPYYVESYTAGEGFVLKANTDYYNELKQPSIETCELVLIPDENTALIALNNGEIDCMNFVSVETYNVLADEGWEIISIADRVNPFWFNTKNELFKDPVVREALCHMIDWEAINELVYDGRYTVPNSIWYGAGESPYGDNYAYDPDLGIQMLTDAGYKLEDIDFTFQADPDFVSIETALVAQLNDLGLVNVDFETFDGATMYGKLKSGDYECFPCHNGYSEESCLTPYTMGLVEGGSQPVVFLKDMNPEAYEEAMAHYNAAVVAPTYEEYVAEVTEITRIVQENNCAMGGLGVTRFYGVSDKISGVYPTPIGGYVEFCYMYVNEL